MNSETTVKTAILFSGQGAQYPGMMNDICEEYSSARMVFSAADKVLKRSISRLCFNSEQTELNITRNTQPCLLAADLAAYYVISSYGVKVDAFAGFSLGEYAALVAAGIIDIENAFRVVQIRADAMQEAVPIGKGAMAAVAKMNYSEVKKMCDGVEGYIVPANINSPEQIVVSGEIDAINEFCVIAKKNRVRVKKLPVSAPFHCGLMEPAANVVKCAINEFELHAPKNCIYCNYDAKPTKDVKKIRQNIIQQISSPVLWEQTLMNMWKDGIRLFIEVGPGETLAGFVKKTLPHAIMQNVNDLDTLMQTLAYLKCGELNDKALLS